MAEAAESLSKVLIVGRSGNGKSSIGNTILKAKMFDVSSLGEEKKSQPEPMIGNGFSVIECSCLKDADEMSDHDFKEAEEAIRNFSPHAILFVMKYGIRFTQQEKQAVERLKQIFGQTVFEDWVIIAFSYGDNFDKDAKEIENSLEKEPKQTGDDFMNWCEAQTGVVQDLFQDVKYRIVLFNNKADFSKNSKCVDELKQNIFPLHNCNKLGKELRVQSPGIKNEQTIVEKGHSKPKKKLNNTRLKINNGNDKVTTDQQIKNKKGKSSISCIPFKIGSR